MRREYSQPRQYVGITIYKTNNIIKLHEENRPKTVKNQNNHHNTTVYFSNEVQILTNELNAASGKLNSMTELADQALKRAKDVYDEALGLYAEVNTTLLPDIKLSKLKETAREMNKTVSSNIIYSCSE